MAALLQFHRRIALYGPSQPLEWLLFLLLLPLSIIYGVVGWLRNKCYDWSLLPSYKSEVPIVSVGNIAAGGTGKTPVVDWLVKVFLAQGKRPAIISRGYGGSFSGNVGIVSKADGLLMNAAEAGDEPFLLARRNPEVFVLIARKRVAGVRQAIDKFGADVIILDDGFQHRAVQRDVDLVLLDAENPYGNRWPLPTGLLREFPASLKRADLLLQTRSSGDSSFCFSEKPVFQSSHRLAEMAISLAGQPTSFQELAGLKLFAFAGIADPQSFFSALATAGLKIEGSLPLGDHCAYDQQLQKDIDAAARGCDALITTEKDAVKLVSEMFNLRCYQVPMNVAIDNEDTLKAKLQQQLWSH